MATRRKQHNEEINIIKGQTQPVGERKLSLIERIVGKTTEAALQKTNLDIEALKKRKYVSNSPAISRYYYEYMQMSRDYVAKFKDFESMLSDPIVQNALEFVCDDVTSFSPITKKRIWPTAENPSVETNMNEFSSRVNLNKRIWDDCFKLCLYGNLMVRIRFKNTDFTGGVDSIEVETNMFRYVPIEVKGILVGWIDSVYDKILEPFEVIHIRIGNFRSERVVDDKYYTIKATYNFDDKQKDEQLRSNFIIGSSIFENVRRIWRQIKLLEDNLILTRLDRSAIVRIFKVAVGSLDSDDKGELLDYYSELLTFDKDLSIADDVLRQNKAQIGHGSNVILPVGSTGDLTVEEFGGESDVRGMADVDMFNKKFFASLKIPPEFLGLGQESTGLTIGEGDLKRKEIRYAKTIKKIQFSLMEGYKQIAYYDLLSRGIDESFDRFDMVMGVVSTAEEEEFKNSLKTSAEAVNTFFEFITSIKETIGDPSINVRYLLEYLTGRVMGMSDLDWEKVFNDFQIPEDGNLDQPVDEMPMDENPEQPAGGDIPEEDTTIDQEVVDYSAPEEIPEEPVSIKKPPRVTMNITKDGNRKVISKIIGMESREREYLISGIRRFVNYMESKRILSKYEETQDTESLKYVKNIFENRTADKQARFYIEDKAGKELSVTRLREILEKDSYINIKNFSGLKYEPMDLPDYFDIGDGKEKKIDLSKIIFTDDYFDSMPIINCIYRSIYILEMNGKYYVDKSNAEKILHELYHKESAVSNPAIKGIVFKVK